MRRLLVLASAMVFLDLTFFTAIAPLLPTYKHDLHLSTAGAGILSAAYAAGTLAASLPAGFVASRFGPRRTVICGLCALGFASLLFGFLKSEWPLDGARFIQGIAGALIWSGALTWLINSYPEDKRGSVIGTALGTAVAGSLLGPVLGALAASIGTEVIFGSVLVVALGLAFIASREPDTVVRENQPLREVLRCMANRELVEAAIFVSSPSLMFGAIDVLLPLRIGSLGGGHALIAIGFVGGAAIESVLSPIAGRLSDRVGRRAPYVLGMSICAVAMLIFAAADSLPIVIFALLVTSLGSGFCFAPAMTLISDAAEESGLHQGYAVGVTNMAWAAAQVVGGVAGAGVAGVTGDAVPSIAVAVVLTVTIFYAFRALAPEPVVAEA
ncbi:MAG TPA: MFS transporter [Solirubrobacterales bacterium]|jgi:MFS family permease|nr:MFS transporter [Solirubrobacterales bacterium]